MWCSQIFTFKPNLFPFGIWFVRSFFFYPRLLCPHHQFLGLSPYFPELFFPFLDFGHHTGSVWLMHSRGISYPYFKWSKTGGIWNVGVELVLDDWKPIAPVILPVVAKNSQCGFHGLICLFALPICFGVVHQTHVLLNSQLFTDFLK